MVALSSIVLCLWLTLIQVEWNVGTVLNFNCKQIRQFVDGHNKIRLQLAKGKMPNQPAATRMTAVLWDNELAKKAAEWASYNIRHNTFKHNPNRTIPSRRFSTGENLYMFYTRANKIVFNPKDTTDSWFTEHKNYKYKTMEISDFSRGTPEIGHYTQMVWENTHYIGCGAAATQFRNKNGWKTIVVVCNYGRAGNVIGEKPYKAGKPIYKLYCGAKNCSRPYGDKCSK